jgi:hypothetical protein
VIAEGDLVAVHSNYKTWNMAGVDIFRLNDDGKIVERWDVLQQIPETTAQRERHVLAAQLEPPDKTSGRRAARTAVARRSRDHSGTNEWRQDSRLRERTVARA